MFEGRKKQQAERTKTKKIKIKRWEKCGKTRMNEEGKKWNGKEIMKREKE